MVEEEDEDLRSLRAEILANRRANPVADAARGRCTFGASVDDPGWRRAHWPPPPVRQENDDLGGRRQRRGAHGPPEVITLSDSDDNDGNGDGGAGAGGDLSDGEDLYEVDHCTIAPRKKKISRIK